MDPQEDCIDVHTLTWKTHLCIMKKRTFIKLAGTAGAGMLLAPLAGCTNNESFKSEEKDFETRSSPFEQAPLGYGLDALSPAIDALTMEIHFGKHHAGYVKKLNKAVGLSEMPLEGLTIEALLSKITKDQLALRNNGGGHFNHSLYWKVLAPGGSPEPEGDLREELADTFGSVDAFYEKFVQIAATRFGSGWAWLIRNASGRLEVTSTPNQDNPLMEQIVEQTGQPLLGIDVWEHAYYLNYQNRRKDYIEAFVQQVNWDVVASNDRG